MSTIQNQKSSNYPRNHPLLKGRRRWHNRQK
jgi:hypothetical protein